MSKKAEDQILRIQDLQRNYISQLKKANETIPAIEKGLEWTEWAQRAIKDAPDNFDTLEMSRSLGLVEDSIKDNLPEFFIKPQLIIGTVSAANATLSAVVFDRINSGAFGINTDQTWINKSNSDYYLIQERQELINMVAKLLVNLDPNGEFLEAIEKYSKFLSGISSHQDVATAMRNVLEGVNGELFGLVIKNSKVKQEKKNKRWEDVSSFLAIGGSESLQSKLLLAEKKRYKEIHSVLSEILKNGIEDPRNILIENYSRWLNWLYTVLNLIDPKYLS